MTEDTEDTKELREKIEGMGVSGTWVDAHGTERDYWEFRDRGIKAIIDLIHQERQKAREELHNEVRIVIHGMGIVNEMAVMELLSHLEEEK